MFSFLFAFTLCVYFDGSVNLSPFVSRDLRKIQEASWNTMHF